MSTTNPRGWMWIAIPAIVVVVFVIIIVVIVVSLGKPPSCASGAPCPAGQICLGGQCVASSQCGENTPCPPGQLCINGQCTPGCDANDPCPSGLVCVNGQCVTPQCSASNPCPAPQQCVNNQCVTLATYVKDVIAQTTPSCPPGYETVVGYGVSDGNLKQGTGGNTPNIYLCIKKDNTPSPPLTDISVFQYSAEFPEQPCPNGSRLTYLYNGSNEFDFEKGCPFAPVSKICVTYGGSNTPISDIVIAASDSSDPACPPGYERYGITNNYGGAGTPGDLNRGCGGKTIMLCVRRG